MNRRAFLGTAAALCLEPWRRVVAQRDGAVIRRSGSAARHKYLLLDSRVIDRTEGLALRLGKITKDPRSPLFVQDKPWEVRWDNADPAVLYDEEEKLYKAWYSPMIVDQATSETPPEKRKLVKYYVGRRQWGTCYATSRDGIVWEKPDLGIVAFEGSRRNNLVSAKGGVGSVVKDLCDPDPARRYKVLQSRAVRFSPDGLHWGEPVPCPEIFALGDKYRGFMLGDTQKSFVWDERARKYVGFTRLWEARKTKEGQNIRLEARTESPDFLRWTPAVEVLRGGPDPQMQVYALIVFPYANVFLGLIALFDTRKDLVHCELAWSPDTVRWERVCNGTPLIPRGPEGRFDWGCIYAAASPIVRNGEIRLYYAGSDGPHTGWRSGGFGLARLRLDGFAGMTAGTTGRVGRIITKRLECAGSRLQITADAKGGSVRVGVLGAAGFDMANCEPVTRDVTDAVVRWRHGRDLAVMKGKPVQLVFELDSAVLYAFSFAG
jgi:hypothetical protein